jgi:hypothetical protein
LRDLYTASGFSPPKHFFWFDSPFIVAWAVALLNKPHDFLGQRMLEAVGRNKRQREHIDGVRAAPCRSAAVSDWKSLLAAAGEPLAANQMRLAGAPAKPVKLIQTSVTAARLQLYENVADAIPHFDGSADLQRAEHHLRGVQSGQAGWSVVWGAARLPSSTCVQAGAFLKIP